MSSRPEIVLYSSLTDVDRLDYLAREGLDLEVIPTPGLRPMVEWSLKYYFESGCTQAPSREALMIHWADALEIESVVLDNPDDEIETMEWVVRNLRSTYVHLQFQQWTKAAATAMAEAYIDDRVQVLNTQASGLGSLLSQVRSHTNEAVGLEGIDAALRRYEERQAMEASAHGLMLGMGLVDQHTHGIHPGELAVLAAGPKVGKSWMTAKAVLTEWLRGRRGMLFTLENSVEMTIDRTICLHARVDYRRWQRGDCTPEQFAQVLACRNELEEIVGEMIVVMPPPGSRTVESMMREAQSRGADSIIIDQLTFIEAIDTRHKARHEVVRDIMHDLKSAISTGSQKLPCLLAHQINREGVKAADKTGYLEMYMLAESSEVERTVDWAFGLYRGEEDRVGGLATLQVLASRREDITAWLLAYAPAEGTIEALREMDVRRG